GDEFKWLVGEIAPEQGHYIGIIIHDEDGVLAVRQPNLISEWERYPPQFSPDRPQHLLQAFIALCIQKMRFISRVKTLNLPTDDNPPFRSGVITMEFRAGRKVDD